MPDASPRRTDGKDGVEGVDRDLADGLGDVAAVVDILSSFFQSCSSDVDGSPNAPGSSHLSGP